MDRYKRVHPMVASPLLEAPSAETPRLTVRWPIISMSPPGGPGIAMIVDYFGPLLVMPRDNTYILLITDRFSSRADMFGVTAAEFIAEFTTEGTANVLVNKHIPLWGCPRTTLSDNGLQFYSKLSQAIYQLLGVCKIATSSYHPNANEGVERMNHAMAQMLAMLVNERQDDSDLQLPHVEFAYNYSCLLYTSPSPRD